MSEEKGKIIFENESEIRMSSFDNNAVRGAIRGYIVDVPKSYDYIKNIKHLILRYNNKLNGLNIDSEHDKITYNEGLYDGLRTAIHDLQNILDGLEV